MKKLISLVLVLALCVSMIPSAMAAENETPATGVYFELENGLPAGTCITGEPDQGGVPIYEGLAYSPNETFTFYYYDNDGGETATLDLSNNNGNRDAMVSGGFVDVDIAPMGGKLWKISLTPTNAAEFNLDFMFRGNSGHNVLFCFRPNTPDVPDLPTYATGFYLSAENDAPSGNVIAGSRPEENGPWGYWDISYDSSKEKVLFYYDAEAASLSVNSKPDGLSVSVEAVENHFWKITLTSPGSGFGGFTLDIRAGDAGFPVSFVDTYVPTYTPGLYYKPLLGVNNDNPHVDPSDPYSNAPLVMSPYFERFDRAFYFYDGNDFTPVEVVFDSDLTVDPVCFDGHPGWYIFAAYDFCSGKIFYDDDSTQTTYYLEVSTCLPDFAFYAGDTVSKENFRMYTIAEENTSTDERFAEYKFSKTLTFLPKDSNFSFGLGPDSDVALDIYCFQRQYLPNGNEVNEIPYTDFEYVWEASSNANGDFITLTLYTNDSDVLCWLEGIRPTGNGGQPDWLFGAYVNVLAPDDDASLLFHANDQGNFASAKFLPQHLFDELAAMGRNVTIGSDQFPGDITLDKDVVGTIAGESRPVSFCMTADAATAEEEALIAAALKNDETSLDVLDLKLYFGNSPKHELGGKATIKYTADLAKGTNVRVYYLNDSGELEQMEAKYQNGNIIFTTNHFSKFLLVTVPAVSPTPDPDPTPSTPSKPSKPIEPEKPAAPDFTDVAEDYWAKDAIVWAAEQGYVNGTSDSEYSPEDNISRQQIWMMLSRVSRKSAEDMTAAKDWAMANGISDGTNPGTAVTRQQLVTLLYRYAVLMGYDVSVGENTNILSYDDVFSVSEYAIPAFQWACGAGVINGTTESTLSPLGTATRAQFAVMLQRFCEKVVK